MGYRYWLLKALKTINLVLILGLSMSGCGFVGDSWKEEVLLHDGTKIIVSRSQSYGGRHEIGQSSSISKASISFTLPGTNQVVTWNDTFAEDLDSENLVLLAIDVVNGEPYLVTTPVGILTNNKWGCRSDPRYVLLKYDGQAWKQIQMSELPVEIKEVNVIGETQSKGAKLNSHLGIVTVNEVKEFNGFYSDDVLYLKNFERLPIGSLDPDCTKLEPIKTPLGNGWQSSGGIKKMD